MRQEGRPKLSLNGLFMLMWFIIYLSTQANYAETSGCLLQTSDEVIGLVKDTNKANISSVLMFWLTE